MDLVVLTQEQVLPVWVILSYFLWMHEMADSAGLLKVYFC
jgi:hypothetical protein